MILIDLAVEALKNIVVKQQPRIEVITLPSEWNLVSGLFKANFKVLIDNLGVVFREDIQDAVDQEKTIEQYEFDLEDEELVQTEDEYAEWIFDFLDCNKRNAFFYATVGGKLIGCAMLYGFGKNSHSTIANVSILPEYQRLGIGNQMMESIMTFAKDNNTSVIRLVSSPANVGWYNSHHGFETEGYNMIKFL